MPVIRAVSSQLPFRGAFFTRAFDGDFEFSPAIEMIMSGSVKTFYSVICA